MKSAPYVLVTAIALLTLFTGCKKDKAKDYNALVTNSVWSGEMKHASKAHAEPFCVAFKADGSFLWHEFSGNYTGTYTVDNGRGNVSIVFSNGRIWAAHITDDNKLSNFEYGQADWELKHVELVTAADQSLDNVSWTGTYSNGRAISLNFKPGNKVNSPSSEDSESDVIYSRINGAMKYQGSDILYYFKYFCVLQGNGKIIGIREAYHNIYKEYSYLAFMATRQ